MSENSIGAKDILTIAAVAAGAYALYTLFQGLGKLGSGVASAAGAAYKGAQAATAPVSNSIASFWTALTLPPSMSGVPGNVVLADGTSLGPLSSMTVKTDTQGNVYVNLGGAVYQLGQSDANGNWPASLMLEPDFGATGGGW